jgi:hypothetical protein
MSSALLHQFVAQFIGTAPLFVVGAEPVVAGIKTDDPTVGALDIGLVPRAPSGLRPQLQHQAGPLLPPRRGEAPCSRGGDHARTFDLALTSGRADRGVIRLTRPATSGTGVAAGNRI